MTCRLLPFPWIKCILVEVFMIFHKQVSKENCQKNVENHSMIKWSYLDATAPRKGLSSRYLLDGDLLGDSWLRVISCMFSIDRAPKISLSPLLLKGDLKGDDYFSITPSEFYILGTAKIGL